MSLTAASALALAFGLATAGFTVVRALFFGTLPGPHGNRIVASHEFNHTGGWKVPLDFGEWTPGSRSHRPQCREPRCLRSPCSAGSART
jgi:hypothetical protein